MRRIKATDSFSNNANVDNSNSFGITFNASLVVPVGPENVPQHIRFVVVSRAQAEQCRAGKMVRKALRRAGKQVIMRLPITFQVCVGMAFSTRRKLSYKKFILSFIHLYYNNLKMRGKL